MLERLREKGVTLNPQKCEFSRNCLTFLGHVLDQKGIHLDFDKIDAIQQMQPPKSITEVRRFLGMINQVGKFSPKLATLSQPLRDLLKRVICGPGAHHREQHLQESRKSSQQKIYTIYRDLCRCLILLSRGSSLTKTKLDS